MNIDKFIAEIASAFKSKFKLDSPEGSTGFLLGPRPGFFLYYDGWTTNMVFPYRDAVETEFGFIFQDEEIDRYQLTLVVNVIQEKKMSAKPMIRIFVDIDEEELWSIDIRLKKLDLYEGLETFKKILENWSPKRFEFSKIFFQPANNPAELFESEDPIDLGLNTDFYTALSADEKDILMNNGFLEHSSGNYWKK